MYDDDLGAVDAEVGHTGCLAQDVLRHAAVASLVILLKISRHDVFSEELCKIDSYIDIEDCVNVSVSDLECEKG